MIRNPDERGHDKYSSNFSVRVGDQSLTYHILHVFRTSTEFIKKSPDHFKDIYKLKLLTSFDVNMTSLLKEVPNYVLNL